MNTRWRYGGARQDLLTGPEGPHIWLASSSLDRRFPADAAAPEHVLVARGALAAATGSPGGTAGIERVNAVPGHGWIRATPDSRGPWRGGGVRGSVLGRGPDGGPGLTGPAARRPRPRVGASIGCASSPGPGGARGAHQRPRPWPAAEYPAVHGEKAPRP
ncbi:ABATE domain-containing protein [Streptomyces avermitilis]